MYQNMSSTNIPTKKKKKKRKEQKEKERKHLFHGKVLFNRLFEDASLCFYQKIPLAEKPLNRPILYNYEQNEKLLINAIDKRPWPFMFSPLSSNSYRNLYSAYYKKSGEKEEPLL
jgi:hypothetical protein